MEGHEAGFELRGGLEGLDDEGSGDAPEAEVIETGGTEKEVVAVIAVVVGGGEGDRAGESVGRSDGKGDAGGGRAGRYRDGG